MEIELNRDNTNLVVNVKGELNTSTAPEFEKQVFPSLDGITDLVLDFKDLIYISSAGLRIILVLYRVMDKQGKMKIINVGESPKSVFDIT